MALSHEVFKVLHRIRPLQHLHIRMQIGPSPSQMPPSMNTSDANEVAFPIGTLPSQHPVPLFMPGTLGYPAGNSFSLGSQKSMLLHQKNVKSLLPLTKQVPPTLSGFHNLRTLELLDMDTLEYVSEMKTCIRNSSSTLSSLKISFSDDLASKSRKPPPEIVSDDESDQEDEFGQGIPPPGPPPGPTPSGAADPNGPSKALKALEEKKKQEAFLPKIFGMEKEETMEPISTMNEQQPTPTDELRARFLRMLAPVTLKLFANPKYGENLGSDEVEVLNVIMEAFEKSQAGQSKLQTKSAGSSTAKATPASSSASTDERAESDPPETNDDGKEHGLFDVPTKKKKANDHYEVSNPDDIDVEEPEGQELALDVDSTALEAPSKSVENKEPEDKIGLSLNLPLDSVALADQMQALESHLAIHSTTREIVTEAGKLKTRIEELKADITAGRPVSQNDYLDLLAAEKAYNKVRVNQCSCLLPYPVCSYEPFFTHVNRRVRDRPVLEELHPVFRVMLPTLVKLEKAMLTLRFLQFNARLDEVTRNLQDLSHQMDQLTDQGQGAITDGSTEMSEYVRSTRGLTLTTLAIYLIPIKASVLSRAIDLRVLESVTLLNVGHQTPFWNIMARENKVVPLPLHKIYTDNVTVPFLVFISQLNNLTELLLLERAQKGLGESVTAKTTVTMEQIRRVILKKHAATLKVLMLRNEAGIEWDMNAKTAMLLCQRAKLLQELAVSFGVRTMHTFLQFMPGLISLRALHTIQFRTDDTCMWVCREFRKFTADNVSHNPHLKLEYIALDSSVERLVRRVPAPEQKLDYKGKGKEIAGNADDSSRKTFAQLVLGSGRVWPDGTSMSSSFAFGTGTSGFGQMNFSEDSEDDDGDELGPGSSGKIGLKLETIEGLRFCDVTGVRIFEKDVVDGRL